MLDHPETARVQVAAAHAYVRAGLPDDARRLLADAERKFPDDFTIARARERLGL